MAKSATSYAEARVDASAIVSAWHARRKRQAGRSERLIRRFQEAGQWDSYAATLHLHLDEFADLYGGTPRARRTQPQWDSDRETIRAYTTLKAAGVSSR